MPKLTIMKIERPKLGSIRPNHVHAYARICGFHHGPVCDGLQGKDTVRLKGPR
ncbi:hypothetical protein [Chelatococcus asaccharovorans]|uniref:Uncharacterized protein n=1 Tax=Chelatococcus asaccharovorans TaxID=28210 RepID=A0A2V3TSR6_9HYPH|nr:hypothetical protein [Chelatococcus asaccharovorans]MBS7705007.1 hypothetical protein [Chelatococcus asaccharovorans]PXW51922.1 hypothetical protein C7450_11877 [Chelatococcus asaccharovorans]